MMTDQPLCHPIIYLCLPPANSFKLSNTFQPSQTILYQMEETENVFTKKSIGPRNMGIFPQPI
jgi:hypothetical protein